VRLLKKLLPSEEPHYQLPSGEPVPPVPIENEYSLPEPNTYDIPRTIETPSVENIQLSTEEKILNNELIIVPTEQKIESTITTEIETMPNVEVKETTTKGSYTLPTEKIKTKKS